MYAWTKPGVPFPTIQRREERGDVGQREGRIVGSEEEKLVDNKC